MSYTVKRPNLSFWEKLYLPSILTGLRITINHLIKMVKGETQVTMQYPEKKWDAFLPEYYRGAPTLVKDDHGRERCVSCQLCEFICPPRAIKIVPGEIPTSDVFGRVEKFPKEFEIDMTRCIYCGLCEEVCPEQAIYLRSQYSVTAEDRAGMIHNKQRLYELGGTFPDLVHKWNSQK